MQADAVASTSATRSGDLNDGPKLHDLKLAHQHLARCYDALSSYTALLHRLHYKSHAQHRGAKWFQSVDGARRCLARLLGRQGDLRQRYTLAVQVASSAKARTTKPRRLQSEDERGVRGNRDEGSRNTRERRESSLQDDGQLVFVQSRIADVVCSFWGQRANGPDLPIGLGARTSSPSEDLLRNLARDLLALALLAAEFAHRCRIAFAALETHLRTPPAPTFAPLVTSLIAQMAAGNELVEQLLYGNASSASNDATSIVFFYEVVQNELSKRQSQDQHTVPKNVFVLNREGETNKAQWSSMVNNVQSRGSTDDLHWLPSSLARPRNKRQLVDTSSIRRSKSTSPSVPRHRQPKASPREETSIHSSLGFSLFDEDIGEAL